METKALAIYNQFDQLERAADALYKSGYFADAKSQAQAIVKVMAGAELGLPPFASMAGIHIIQGKPALGANVIATLVKNDPRYDYQVEKATDDECILIWFEGGKRVGTSSFTLAEAKRAGLVGKDNWSKFPSDMLFARAITRGARRYAPGIFGGSPVYTPEELGADTDEEGNLVIDGQAKEPQPEPVIQPAQPAPTNGKNQPMIPPMTLEEAENVTNSEGVRYGDLATETLTYMINAMAKLVGTPKERPEYATKMLAIQTILAARQAEQAKGE